jgi:recombination endonuclease VII
MALNNKAADKRLTKVYNAEPGYYENTLFAQGGVCVACLRPPGTVRLSVDHDHNYDRAKILMVRKEKNCYFASAEVYGVRYTESGSNKSAVRRALKMKLRRASLRGLLHYPCNKGLSYFRDDPERLEAAARYLRAFRKTG